MAVVDTNTGALVSGAAYELSGRQTGPLISDGDRAYQTTTTSSGTATVNPRTYVAIFDENTGQMVGASPIEIAGDNSDNVIVGQNDRVYLVATQYSNPSNFSDTDTVVAVIDTATGVLVGGAPLVIEAPRANALVIDDDHRRAYLTTSQNNVTQVTIINTETRDVVATSSDIEGSPSNCSLVLNESGDRAYLVTQFYNGSGFETNLTAIDTGDGSDENIITVDGYSINDPVLDDNNHIYLTTVDNNITTVRAIDSDSGVVLDSVDVEDVYSSYPAVLSKSGDLVYVYLSGQADDGTPMARMAVFDTATGTAAPTIELAGQSYEAIDVGDHVYVTTYLYDEEDGSATTAISIIDGHTGQKLTSSPMEIDGFIDPNVITVGDRAYLVTYDDIAQTVHFAVIDLENYELLNEEPIAVTGSLEDYVFDDTEDGAAHLLVSAFDEAAGTYETTIATVDPVSGDVDPSAATSTLSHSTAEAS